LLRSRADAVEHFDLAYQGIERIEQRVFRRGIAETGPGAGHADRFDAIRPQPCRLDLEIAIAERAWRLQAERQRTPLRKPQ
jgi:hypothetical protein